MQAHPTESTDEINPNESQPSTFGTDPKVLSTQNEQGSLADDRRKSWSKFSDRLPRSSRIFQGRDGSEKRKSRVLEPSPNLEDALSDQQAAREAVPAQSATAPHTLTSAELQQLEQQLLDSKHGNTHDSGRNHGALRSEDLPFSTIPVDAISTHYAEPRQPGLIDGATTIPDLNSHRDPRLTPGPTSLTNSPGLPLSSLSTNGASGPDFNAVALAGRRPNDHRGLFHAADVAIPPKPPLPTSDVQSPPSPNSIDLPIHGNYQNRSPKRSSVTEANAERRSRRSQSIARSILKAESRSASKTSRLKPEDEGRISTEEIIMPPNFYPGNLTREEALIPRHQATEYSLEGIGPPAIPQADVKDRSRRGSKSSAFFKRLSRTFTDSENASQERSAIDHAGSSPATSSIALDSRSKRSSTFGLHQNRSDRPEERTQRPTLSSKGSSNVTTLLVHTTVDDEDEFPMRPKQRTNSAGISKHFQRAATTATTATTATKDAKGGKRNRFSRLGTIFGKGNHRQSPISDPLQRKSVQEKQISSTEAPVSDEQHMEPNIAVARRRQSAHDKAGPPPNSNLVSVQDDQQKSAPPRTSGHYEFYHPRPPPPPAEPPVGGYYAPKNDHGALPSRRVHPELIPQQGQNLPVRQSSNGPAYFQDLSARSPATSPPAKEPSKGQQTSFDFFRKSSRTEQPEDPPTKQRRESRSAWNRFSRQRQSSHTKPSNNPSQPAQRIISPPENVHPQPSFIPTEPPMGEGIDRYNSPPPPPPPPKDEWHRATPRRSSLAAKPLASNVPNVEAASGPNTIVNYRPVQGLPILQTDLPSPSLGTIPSGFTSPPTSSSAKQAMSYNDQRRSRQWELEHLPPTSASTSMSPREKRRSEIEKGYTNARTQPTTREEKRRSRQNTIETGHVNSGGRDEVRGGQAAGGMQEVQKATGGNGDPEIKMSATSLPGQEWMPEHGYGWMDDRG